MYRSSLSNPSPRQPLSHRTRPRIVRNHYHDCTAPPILTDPVFSLQLFLPGLRRIPARANARRTMNGGRQYKAADLDVWKVRDRPPLSEGSTAGARDTSIPGEVTPELPNRITYRKMKLRRCPSWTHCTNIRISASSSHRHRRDGGFDHPVHALSSCALGGCPSAPMAPPPTSEDSFR